MVKDALPPNAGRSFPKSMLRRDVLTSRLPPKRVSFSDGKSFTVTFAPSIGSSTTLGARSVRCPATGDRVDVNLQR